MDEQRPCLSCLPIVQVFSGILRLGQAQTRQAVVLVGRGFAPECAAQGREGSKAGEVISQAPEENRETQHPPGESDDRRPGSYTKTAAVGLVAALYRAEP
jgi:hypothetical protein